MMPDPLDSIVISNLQEQYLYHKIIKYGPPAIYKEIIWSLFSFSIS
jgi:hypothetical protein